MSEVTIMNCLGCDREIHIPIGKVFAYTCGCGAIVFHKDGQYALPASLPIAMTGEKDMPHLDYYIGKSNFTSVHKENFITELQSKGAVWAWECDECRERVLERTKFEIDFHPALRDELHPVLLEMLGVIV